MKAFIYQAALLCELCAKETSAKLPPSADSDTYPQGPYGNGGGEADTPQHCDHCRVFLENPLTMDGGDYVREQAAPYISGDDPRNPRPWSMIADRAEEDGRTALAEWIRYYLAPGM